MPCWDSCALKSVIPTNVMMYHVGLQYTNADIVFVDSTCRPTSRHPPIALRLSKRVAQYQDVVLYIVTMAITYYPAMRQIMEIGLFKALT